MVSRKESCHRLSLHTSSVVSEKVFDNFCISPSELIGEMLDSIPQHPWDAE